jgi:putative endonuclease
MMTNFTNTVLYTGVTNNLERRVFEHKQKLLKGFTQKYNVKKIVYFETTENIQNAIEREKQIKGWTRQKKNQLINDTNAAWNDLSEDWN